MAYITCNVMILASKVNLACVAAPKGEIKISQKIRKSKQKVRRPWPWKLAARPAKSGTADALRGEAPPSVSGKASESSKLGDLGNELCVLG